MIQERDDHRDAVRRGRGERGYVLATTAIVLIPLMIMVGFATDVGAWYAEGTRMQRAADAAALGGVVWLPDTARATATAIEVARKNGFDDADPDVTVTVVNEANTRLRVDISDSRADQYFSQLVIDNKTITRSAVSEYVLGVPLGSPKNYLGTGDLLTGIAPEGPEGFWLAVNGVCTPRESGDPIAPRWMGNSPAGGPVCPGTYANPQYRSTRQYTYAVTVPDGPRPGPIVVKMFSPHAGSQRDPGWDQNISMLVDMRKPDATPLNADDNPPADCAELVAGSRTFDPGAPAPGEPAAETMFGTFGWVPICTIPTTASAGQYFIDVSSLDNGPVVQSYNLYSLIASYNGDETLCDARTDLACPHVAAANALSIYATSNAPKAEFYLADVGAQHAGKKMTITLFDPGEGGDYIEILDPAGVPVPFTWKTDEGDHSDYTGGPETKLDVSPDNMPQLTPGERHNKYKFNDRFLKIEIDLPADYAARYGGDTWWKIRYAYQSSVFDRTTWGVTIGGDPVHLVR